MDTIDDTPRMHKTQLLGTEVWVTSVPWFFGEDDPVVVEPERGSVPSWIDRGLVPGGVSDD